MKYFNHNQKELSELSIEKSEKQTTNFVYSVLEYQFIPFPSERISNLNTMFKKKYPEYSFNVKNFDFYKSINYPRFWYNIFYNYYIYFKTNEHPINKYLDILYEHNDSVTLLLHQKYNNGETIKLNDKGNWFDFINDKLGEKLMKYKMENKIKTIFNYDDKNDDKNNDKNDDKNDN